MALFLLPMMISLQMGGGLVAKLCPALETPWTVAHLSPLSMGFPRQENWSQLRFSFSRESSQPRDRTRVSGIAGRLFVSFPYKWSFPGGSASKESTFNVGDLGSIPRLGRSPGEGNSYPLQYPVLKNSDRGAWWATVHGVAKCQTQLVGHS